MKTFFVLDKTTWLQEAASSSYILPKKPIQFRSAYLRGTLKHHDQLDTEIFIEKAGLTIGSLSCWHLDRDRLACR